MRGYRGEYLGKLVALATQQRIVQFFILVAVQAYVDDVDWFIGCRGSRRLIG